MKLIVTLTSCFLVLFGMAGCATPRIGLVSGMVTTGGEFKFEEVPVSDVHLKETAIVLTHLSWSPATEEAGRHKVQWLWYSGVQLVHMGKKDVNFRKTPYRLHSFVPAAGLGLGHYRVDVLIDGKLIDTQEFNIVP
jgi:hypothetical protein